MVDFVILVGIMGAVSAIVWKKIKDMRAGKSSCGCGCGCSGCPGCKTEGQYHHWEKNPNRHGRKLWRFWL